MKELDELKAATKDFISAFRRLRSENEELRNQLEALMREREMLRSRLSEIEQRLRKALEKIEILEK